jgi:hypothetical protein
MKIEWITPRLGGRLAGSRNRALMIGVSKNAQGKAQSYITLYGEFCKEMRIQSGDRIMVGDAGTHIAIKRVNSGGYALCPTGAAKEERQKKLGTFCTSTVKLTSTIVSEAAVFNREEIEILDDSTILIPKFKKEQK